VKIARCRQFGEGIKVGKLIYCQLEVDNFPDTALKSFIIPRKPHFSKLRHQDLSWCELKPASNITGIRRRVA